MKTAVIYARYSSTNQTEQSIEGQVHVCEDYANRHDILIVDSYIDRAISGTTDNRESFQKMLKDSNNKKWDYVLVYKLDRFARNKFESAIHRKHLKDNGIKLLSAMENIPETPEGILLESLLEGMNQYFSEELAQKVSRGLHESRMKGHCIGSVSYGYIKENKMLKINEDEATILKRIFEDYKSGKTILQISRDFEKENITIKGKKFIPQTIRDMLNRKLYTGEYEVNGKEYNNIYPQIISKELYTQVQKRLAKTRYGCRKENHEVFLLRNKIYCGCCRRKMYPVSSNSYNKPLRYYACYNTEKEDGCSTKRVYKDFIEDVVNTVIQATFKNPTNLKNISTKIYEIYKKQNAKNNSLVALKNDLQKVNNSISNIMIAIEKGVITNTTKSRLQELETQQLELQQKIVIEQSKQRFELTKEDIKDTFESMLKESSNAVIDYLIRYVRVFQGRIEISLNNMLEQTDENYIPYIQKIYTATHTTERLLKGGKTHTKSENYEVYIII